MLLSVKRGFFKLLLLTVIHVRINSLLAETQTLKYRVARPGASASRLEEKN